MDYLIFIASLLLIYESSVYLVFGQTIKEKNDCTKFYNYLNGDSKEYDKNSCCTERKIDCDEDGYIKEMSNYIPEKGYPDFASFPSFSKIEYLSFMEIDLKEIPNGILKLSTLKNLIFYNCNVEIIPPAIQDLSNLEELRIQSNKVKKLPNEMFNLPNLKSLNLIGNYIEEIPPAIKNLSKLEEFLFNSNDLKELPNEIFTLPNIKKIHLGDNPYLGLKLTKFGNSTLEVCDLEDVNILCYEPETCKTMTFGNREITDNEAVNVFKMCSIEDLIQRNNTSQDDSKKPNSLPIVIILCVVVNLIAFFITFLLVKLKRSKRSKTKVNDEFRNGSVKVVLNNNRQSIVNSYEPGAEKSIANSYNPNVEVNNNNNINIINNRNSNITNNILNRRSNLNPNININPNIMVNSNGINSNIIPVRVVYVDNPYNHAMNINNNNGANHFSTSVDEINEPPPEYTEL